MDLKRDILEEYLFRDNVLESGGISKYSPRNRKKLDMMGLLCLHSSEVKCWEIYQFYKFVIKDYRRFSSIIYRTRGPLVKNVELAIIHRIIKELWRKIAMPMSELFRYTVPQKVRGKYKELFEDLIDEFTRVCLLKKEKGRRDGFVISFGYRLDLGDDCYND